MLVRGVLLLTILETPALKELKIKFEEESGPDIEKLLEDSSILNAKSSNSPRNPSDVPCAGCP
jgi:hypothetical protein